MRTFRIYSPSSFQIVNTLSFTLVAALHTAPLGLTNCITGSLCLLTHLVLPPPTASLFSIPTSLGGFLFVLFFKIPHISEILLCLFFSELICLSIKPSESTFVVTNSKIALFFMGEYYVYSPHFLYPFICSHFTVIEVSIFPQSMRCPGFSSPSPLLPNLYALRPFHLVLATQACLQFLGSLPPQALVCVFSAWPGEFLLVTHVSTELSLPPGALPWRKQDFPLPSVLPALNSLTLFIYFFLYSSLPGNTCFLWSVELWEELTRSYRHSI